MGSELYLGRVDDRVLFELGKMWFWADVFFRREQAGVLVLTDAAALARDLATAWQGEPKDVDAGYFDQVARRLVEWGRGGPLVTLNDDDDEMEPFRNERGLMRIDASIFDQSNQ